MNIYKRKFLALALSACIILQTLSPVAVVAESNITLGDNMTVTENADDSITITGKDCTHHTHDETCEFTESTACTFDTATCVECNATEDTNPPVAESGEAESPTEGESITAITPLGAEIANQGHPVGTLESEVKKTFPTELSVTTATTETTVPVTWVTESKFTEETADKYTLTDDTYIYNAKIADGYILDKDVSLPTITINTVAITPMATVNNDLTVTEGIVDTDYTYADGVLTFIKDGTYIITGRGTTTTNKIVVQTGLTNVSITLNNVNITHNDGTATTAGTCAFDIQGNSTVNLTLTGTNVLKSGFHNAGLQVQTRDGNTATLNIIGGSAGSLIATGGNNGAGIGGGINADGGSITISGGSVTANGGSRGAGIGGGEVGAGGTITIDGAADVTSTGGLRGAGIGGGLKGSGGKISIAGTADVKSTGGISGAGIGSGSGSDITGGEISISGGTVAATGGYGGAGIGGGDTGSGGKISISDGTVTANGGEYGAGIGSGSGTAVTGVTGGEINLSGGTIKAFYKEYGAGIGGGNNADGGSITIRGTADVETKRTVSNKPTGAGIGGGYGKSGGTINISGGKVAVLNSYGGAGIGGGYQGTAGKITISGGIVSVIKDNDVDDGACIGSGSEGVGGGDITISGGYVTAISAFENGKFAIGESGRVPTGQSNKGTLSSGTSGTAYINAGGVNADKTNFTSGVLFDGNHGKIYGTSYNLAMNAEVMYGKTLTIESGKTLDIAKNIILTNNGTIINENGATISGEGTLHNQGILDNKGTINVNQTGFSAYNGEVLDVASGNIVINDVNIKQGTTNYLIPSTAVPINITGTTTENTVHITDGTHTINLKGVDISIGTVGTSKQIAPIHVTKGSVTFFLVDGTTNILKNDFYNSGLRVMKDAVITIDGTGTLNATGGVSAAGIGGKGPDSTGTININGGIINAIGGETAVGIGCGTNFPTKGGTLSSSPDGNAVISANGINSNMAGFTSGVIFDGNNGTVYGNQTLAESKTLENNKNLTINKGGVLNINTGITLTNSGGTIHAIGEIKGEGTINGTGAFTVPFTADKISGVGDLVYTGSAFTVKPTKTSPTYCKQVFTMDTTDYKEYIIEKKTGDTWTESVVQEKGDYRVRYQHTDTTKDIIKTFRVRKNLVDISTGVTVTNSDLVFGNDLIVEYVPEAQPLTRTVALNNAQLYYDTTPIGNVATLKDGKYTMTYNTGGKAIPISTNVTSGATGLHIKFGGDNNLESATIPVAGVTLTAKPLENVAVTGIESSYTYTGSAIEPTITSVKDGATTLVSGTDYDVTYGTSNTDVGTSTGEVEFEFKGNYSGTDTKNFSITKIDPTVTLDVTKQTRSTTGTYGDDFVLTATVSGINGEKPTGTVVFKDGKTTIATEMVTDGKATFTMTDSAPKNYNITAEFTAATDGTGKNYNNKSSTAKTLDISKANQTIAIVEVTDKKFNDKTFDLAITGKLGTGAVTYTVPNNNGVLAINGSTATIVGVGKVTVTANLASDDNYNGATTTSEITIGKAPEPSITYPTASGITYGSALSTGMLTEGSTEYGTFAWTDGTIIPTCANSGYKVTFTPNADTIKNYETITNLTATLNVTVSKADPAVSVNIKSITGEVGNRFVTLEAKVSKVGGGEVPTGKVTFKQNDTTIGTPVTLTNGTATTIWNVTTDGTYKVNADYSGSNNYITEISKTLSVDTTKQAQPITINPIAEKTYGDATFKLSSNGSTGTGAITYESSDPSVISISGTTATIKKIGQATITVTIATDDAYISATADQVVTVNPKTLTVKVADETIIIGETPTYKITPTGLVSGEILTGVTLTGMPADTATTGTHTITPSGGTISSDNSNYNITYAVGTLTITFDTAEITSKISDANTAKKDIIVGTSASNVDNGKKFVTQSELDALNIAIVAAENAKINATTEAELKTATTALNTAIETFKNSIKTGTKSTGGSVVVPTPTAKPLPPTLEDAVVIPTVDGDTVVVEITEKNLDTAIANAKAEAEINGTLDDGISVTIKVDSENISGNNIEFNLSQIVSDVLIKENAKDFTIKSEVINFTLDLNTVKEIQKQIGNGVTVKATKTESVNLSEENKALIENRPVFTFEIISEDGTKVTDFADGFISVAIPYDLKDGETSDNITVYYITETGELEEVTGATYNQTNKEVVFKTNHFSTFAVGVKTVVPNPTTAPDSDSDTETVLTPETTNSGLTITILIVVAVILVIGIGVVVVVKKNKD